MSIRWAFMEKFEVPDYDDPTINYLTRWRLIQTPWCALYLHKFGAPDSRPTLHDHPWPFLSIVLRGGYVEQVPGRTTYSVPHRVRRFNRKRSTDLHYIETLDRTPSWTLMLVGPRRRVWGYTDRDGRWTRFDEHPHATEFDKAIGARQRASA